MVSKTDYILESLRATRTKKWEYFVVSRLIHLLLKEDIEFVTQQYVRRPSGRALTDIYFPQISLHIEVDEIGHLRRGVEDRARELDIVDATGHRIERIVCWSADEGSSITYVDLIERIDMVADKIIKEHKKIGATQWSFDEKYLSSTYLKRGYISASENVAFRTHQEALKCFGYTGGHFQRALWRFRDKEGLGVWFPKLYANDRWVNSLSEDGLTIEEKRVHASSEYYRNRRKEEDIETRIVFAHSKNNLNQTLYRFLGVYKMESVSRKNSIVWHRISTNYVFHE